MALISCKDLTLAYDGVNVVEGMSFDVNEGDYLCVVGENGSGKSTLMKALLGLIKPVGGIIDYGDGLSNNQIGYLPQQTEIQRDFPASVEEVVLSGTIGRMNDRIFHSSEDRKLARKNMELLDIWDIRRSCYNQLSGGQQQRVLLARALCATGKLLLLDEPVAGLDPIVTGEMYRIISRLNREQGITVIMISHDIGAVVGEAGKVLHLRHKAEFFGTVEEYRRSKAWQSFQQG